MAEGEKPDPKPAAPPRPKAPERFIVEVHTTFEVLGSTVTFRENQIVVNERELALAREHNVPMRAIAPVR